MTMFLLPHGISSSDVQEPVLHTVLGVKSHPIYTGFRKVTYVNTKS